MDCEDFREHIFKQETERLSTAETKDFDTHQQICPSCRDALRDWQQIESLLRASWPSEDPRIPFFVPPARGQAGWVYNVRNWVSAASTAVLAASLLLLALLRPSIQYNEHELSFSFGQAGSRPQVAPAQPVSQVQVQAWAHAAAEQVVAQETARLQSASRSMSDSSSAEESRRLARMRVELEMLKETEASLWQEVQRHGLYLQSAWQRPSQPIGPNQAPSVSPQ